MGRETEKRYSQRPMSPTGTQTHATLGHSFTTKRRPGQRGGLGERGQVAGWSRVWNCQYEETQEEGKGVPGRDPAPPARDPQLL